MINQPAPNPQNVMSSLREFFDPYWEQTSVVLIGLETLRRAEHQILSCEACTPDEADLPFDCVLDRITGCDPRTTEYVLPKRVLCPRCYAAVTSGYCRWRATKGGGRKLLTRPGTLVAVKNDA